MYEKQQMFFGFKSHKKTIGHNPHDYDRPSKTT
jgi:hypothetical protein